MDMNMNMNIFDYNEFPELNSSDSSDSSASSVKSGGEVNLGRFGNVSNDSGITFGTFGEAVPKKIVKVCEEEVVVITESQKQPKRFFCKNIVDGKDCPFDKKCIFAHSYEEKHNDDCNFGDNCIHIYFSKSGYCMNANPKVKMCFRKHPSENLETYNKRVGTNKKFPNVPEKVPTLDRKFTKMCRSVTDKDSEPCDRTACTFAHDDHELIILPCRFKERCRNVEVVDGLFKNKEKICRFLHENETKENHKLRMTF